MKIGMRFEAEGKPDDPIVMTPPSPLDAPALRGPLGKDRREDLQTQAFMLAVSLVGSEFHPLEVARGGDPPDRIIAKSAVELTELTVPEIRRDLAQARHLGRLLHAEIARDARRFAHLLGRRVCLAVIPGEEVSKETLVPQICTTLEADRGCVGDGVDLSAGLPQQWPSDRGFYGKHGPAIVTCYHDGVPGSVLVSATCQSELSLSQTLDAIRKRVEAKDCEGNEVLLMSCGMPDQTGCVCPIDIFMFDFIEEHRERIRPGPTHLKAVLLHLWGTPRWIELYRTDDAIIGWLPRLQIDGSLQGGRR